jgi:hypothetical protein
MTAGTLVLGTGLLLALRYEPNSSYLGVILPSMVVMGSGMALTMAPMTSAVMGSVPVQRAGVASAATNTSRELGGVFGIALLGAVVTSAFNRAFQARLLVSGFPPRAVHAITSGAAQRGAAAGRVTVAGVLHQAPPGTPRSAAVTIVSTVHHSFTHAIHVGLLIAAGFAVLASIVSVTFVRSHAGQDHGTTPQEATVAV